MTENWKTSSYCMDGPCVEVGWYGPATVAVRDTKNPEVELLFTRQEWAAFVAGIKTGEFDPP